MGDNLRLSFAPSNGTPRRREPTLQNTKWLSRKQRQFLMIPYSSFSTTLIIRWVNEDILLLESPNNGATCLCLLRTGSREYG